jgi:hypothetical protein
MPFTVLQSIIISLKTDIRCRPLYGLLDTRKSVPRMLLSVYLHRDYLSKPTSLYHQTGYDWPNIRHTPDESTDLEDCRFSLPVIRKRQVWIATWQLDEIHATGLKLNARRRSVSKLTLSIRENEDIPRFPILKRKSFHRRMSEPGEVAILPVRWGKINSPVRKAVTDVFKPPDILSLQ